MYITTKHGVFEVQDNNNGGVTILSDNVKVVSFPRCSWWNKDLIEEKLDKYFEGLNS